MKDTHLATQVQKEITDFKNKTLSVISAMDSGEVRLLNTNGDGYAYNQIKVLNTIERYFNSQFESGRMDTEGQQKLFLNITKFIVDVSQKNTDIDVKDYIFQPDGNDDIWKTWLMARQFKVWARNEHFGKLLNELAFDRVKYGTCVIKKVNSKTLERVPIKNIICSQDSRSLKEAVETGGYVIERHFYTYHELQNMKGWDIEGIDKYEYKKVVYERYALTPENIVKEGGDKDKMVVAMSIIMPHANKNRKNHNNPEVLFISESDVPYEECHWSKQDGRWLGIGCVEEQFENQVARNLEVNLRRRALLWGAKKVFQSSDETIAKNLVKDVRDGEVLHITQNGQITQVNTSTQSLSDLASFGQVWEGNSKEKAQTFEVATGEGMASGTPFRLGVLLSNSVQEYFGLKKEDFGLFLQEVFFNQMIPIFIKNSKEYTLRIAGSEEGLRVIKYAMKEYHISEYVQTEIMNGRGLPDNEQVQAEIENQMNKHKNMFIEIPAGYYKDAKYYLELNITGENKNTAKDVETLTTIWQALQAKGDPKAEPILRSILALVGQNIDILSGEDSKKQIPQDVQSPEAQMQQGMTDMSKMAPEDPNNVPAQ